VVNAGLPSGAQANRAIQQEGSNMTEGGYRKWECVICGFIYDEAEGLPEDGIASGTRFEDLPEDWECPDCGISKADFEPMEA
jgi:rubredoxin